MELRQNRITVGELLDDPRSRQIFQRHFPTVLKHPLLGAARQVTLEQLIAFARAYLPEKKIRETLDELRKA